MTKTKSRPTTRSERQAKNPVSLPASFRPKFLSDLDGRHVLVRAMRRKIKRLIRDSGARSEQQKILCELAAFLQVRMREMILQSLETGAGDNITFTQVANSLSSALTKLGLQYQAKKVADDLDDHLAKNYRVDEEDDDDE